MRIRDLEQGSTANAHQPDSTKGPPSAAPRVAPSLNKPYGPVSGPVQRSRATGRTLLHEPSPAPMTAPPIRGGQGRFIAARSLRGVAVLAGGQLGVLGVQHRQGPDQHLAGLG